MIGTNLMMIKILEEQNAGLIFHQLIEGHQVLDNLYKEEDFAEIQVIRDRLNAFWQQEEASLIVRVTKDSKSKALFVTQVMLVQMEQVLLQQGVPLPKTEQLLAKTCLQV